MGGATEGPVLISPLIPQVGQGGLERKGPSLHPTAEPGGQIHPPPPTHKQKEMKVEAIVLRSSGVTKETMMGFQVESSRWIESMSVVANFLNSQIQMYM